MIFQEILADLCVLHRFKYGIEDGETMQRHAGILRMGKDFLVIFCPTRYISAQIGVIVVAAHVVNQTAFALVKIEGYFLCISA